MKRFALMVALCLVSAVAHAKGVPFAVESLQKAQELVKKDAAPGEGAVRVHLQTKLREDRLAGVPRCISEMTGEVANKLLFEDFPT